MIRKHQNVHIYHSILSCLACTGNRLVFPLLLFVSGFCMGKGIQATCLVQGSADSLNHLLTHHGHLSEIPHLHRTFMPSTPITRFFRIPVTRSHNSFPGSNLSIIHCCNSRSYSSLMTIDYACYNLWDGNGNGKVNYRCSQMDERFAMDAGYSLLNTYVQAADNYLEKPESCSLCAVQIRCLHLLYLQSDPAKHHTSYSDF